MELCEIIISYLIDLYTKFTRWLSGSATRHTYSTRSRSKCFLVQSIMQLYETKYIEYIANHVYYLETGTKQTVAWLIADNEGSIYIISLSNELSHLA